MENKRDERESAEVSPDDAKAALHTVSEVASSAEWTPRRWAAAVVGLAFAVTVAALTWEAFWWVAGSFGALAVLVFLLRRQLFNPLVRARPWQHLDKQDGGGRWLPTFWAIWIPMTILIPAEPRWIGPIVGVLAGAHAYWGLRVLGESR